jgi:outer membrane protein OmpA-like peptidoglycan-associated protein
VRITTWAIPSAIALLLAGSVNGQTPPPPPPPDSAPPPPAEESTPSAPDAEVSARAPRRTDDRPDRWAVSPIGSTGLLRTSAADSVTPGLFRIGLGVDFFSAGGVIGDNDDATRFRGILSLSAAPIEYLEAWINVRLSSVDSSLTEPGLLQTQGDLGFGIKGFYPIVDTFSLGAEVQLDVLSDVGNSGFGAVRVQPRFLSTVDLQKLAQPIPLRFHFNAGFLVDNSDDLIPADGLTTAEQFALGIAEFNRVTAAAAIEAPFKFITPYLEYAIEIPVDYLATPGVVVDDGALAPKQAVPVPIDEPGRPALSRVIPQRLTPGLRVTAARDFTFDVAVEIGLTPATTVGVPPVPPYNVVFLASYAIDPFGVREPARGPATGPAVSVPVIVPAGPGGGARLTGQVVDQESEQPIRGAIVRFDRSTPVATDDAGRFESQGMEGGPLSVTVTKEGYEPGTATLELAPEQSAEVRVALSPAAFAGSITGQVRGPEGPIAGARVRITGPEGADATTDEEGRFAVSLPEGTYRITVEQSGRLATGAVAALARGERPFISLRMEPADDPARLEGSTLFLGNPVLFSESAAELSDDAQPLLARAVDWMIRFPDAKIVIEGHTDSSGEPSVQQGLSRQRAETVRDFLVARGIESERLSLRAFGGDRPVAPNDTLRGRALNNRVELQVEDSGAAEFEDDEDN